MEPCSTAGLRGTLVLLGFCLQVEYFSVPWLCCVLVSRRHPPNPLSGCICRTPQEFSSCRDLFFLRLISRRNYSCTPLCPLLLHHTYRVRIHHRNTRTGRRTDGQTGRETARRTDVRTDRRTNGPRTDGRTDGRSDGGTDGRTDERTDRQTDARTEGRTDGRTD